MQVMIFSRIFACRIYIEWNYNGASMNRENQNIEYKESWRDEYLKWVCGFANGQGGKLYIGIDDRGNVCGVDNAHRLSEDIPNKIVALLGVVADQL